MIFCLYMNELKYHPYKPQNDVGISNLNTNMPYYFILLNYLFPKTFNEVQGSDLTHSDT